MQQIIKETCQHKFIVNLAYAEDFQLNCIGVFSELIQKNHMQQLIVWHEYHLFCY